MKTIILLTLVGLSTTIYSQKLNINTKKITNMENTYYIFKPLPYSYNALEPWIDAKTMEIHYDRHHRTYYNNFVKAMLDKEYPNKPIIEIFSEISKYDIQIRNMGGGYWNHEFFWDNMTGEETKMSDNLKIAIDEQFGSIEKMIEQFSKSATSLFGSGWTWLIVTKDKKLKIVNTSNQDNPYMDISNEKGTPILAIDVWEHAYYLKYQNVRADYVKNFWNVVNWNIVSERYQKAIN